MKIEKINFTVNRNGIINTLAWFICFGLSFAAQALNIIQQAAAFIILYIIVNWLFFALGLVKGASALGVKMIAIASMLFIFSLGLTVFFSWAAEKVFDIDLTIAFQLITLGQVIAYNSKID